MQSLRTLGTVRSIADVAKVMQDIQYNFNVLNNTVPRLDAIDPAAGVINFLVLESDGTWHQWQILAGAGVSFVQDNSARTLTIKAP